MFRLSVSFEVEEPVKLTDDVKQRNQKSQETHKQ